MSKYIQVSCPHCQRSLRVRKEYGDSYIACKYCEHAFHPKLPVECPQCKQTLNIRLSYLGRRVSCGQCNHAFRSPRPEHAIALWDARLDKAMLEEQVRQLREDHAVHTASTESQGAAAAEGERLQATVDELQEQLEQARIDLEQAAGLRDELDAARNSSKQLLDSRMSELMERTREVERLREQLSAAQAEYQQLHTKLEAAQALSAELESARAEAETLREEVRTLTAGHEEHLARLTAELDSLRASHEETESARASAAQVAEELRGQIADLERAHGETAEGHAAALEEARSGWQTQRQAIHAEWEAKIAEEQRRWQEHDTAARQQIDEARAEIDRVRQEWERRHHEAVSGHEQRLGEEQARAAEQVRHWEERHAEVQRLLEGERAGLQGQIEQRLGEEQARAAEQVRHWQERHAEAQRLLEEERAGLQGQIEQLRGEAEALRQERDQHAARGDEAEGRASAEIARLTADIERLAESASTAARREAEQQETLTRLQTEAAAETQSLREKLDAVRTEAEELRRALAERGSPPPLAAPVASSDDTQAELQGRLDAALQQVAALIRERDEALAGWDVAARFVRESEERSNVEITNLAAALEAARRDQTAQTRRQEELHSELESARKQIEGLRALRDQLVARGEQAAVEPAAGAQQLQALQAQAAQHEQDMAALRQELETAHAEMADKSEELQRTRQLQEEQARRAEQERHEIFAEAERLRGLIENMSKERDELAAVQEQQGALPSHPEVWRRFDELAARVENQKTDLERLAEEIVAASKQEEQPQSGVFGRLLGRTPAPRRPTTDVGGLGRRLDSMRVEVAVERERALRVVAEMARANLERQLADALAQLRLAHERPGPAAPAGNVISMPPGHVAGPQPDYRDFLTPPASTPRSTPPARPRRVEDPI